MHLLTAALAVPSGVSEQSSMHFFSLKAALIATSIAVSFGTSATAAHFSLVASVSDVSQALTFGRFDPSLGVLSGFRVNLQPAPTSPYAIRIGSATAGVLFAEAARSVTEINEVLKPGGPDSSILFDRFWQATSLCRVGTRNAVACSEVIDFSDMPVPTAGELKAPADLPPPNVAASTAKTADAEAAMTSFSCIAYLSATFACAASLELQPEENRAIGTIANAAAPTAEPHAPPRIGAGLTAIGAALVMLGGGTVAYRRASRRSRRHGRW